MPDPQPLGRTKWLGWGEVPLMRRSSSSRVDQVRDGDELPRRDAREGMSAFLEKRAPEWTGE
jgi:hypothetical protein